MFDKKFEDRLAFWRKFRDSLEFSPTPFEDTINLYKQAPLTSKHIDPWDQSTWPTPWQLLDENQYSDFCIVLGWCYSLQLTDKFKGSVFEIHIGMDYSKSQTFYVLIVDDNVIGYNRDQVINVCSLPESFVSQRIYVMPPLH